ncbi:MAG: caspase family protein [Planctomycetia bacterium]|nr:caspase family protein [Planctomycetia bacterium]
MISRRRSFTTDLRQVCVGLIVVGLFGAGAFDQGRRALAADAPAARPKSWALLIGCGEYEKARRLDFIRRDVDTLRETLVARGGYDPKRITAIHDGAADDKKPRRAVIEQAVTTFLAQPAADDRIVVYFSGHGFRAADGKMYLAPIDCDPESPEKSGVAVQWLRERLAACPAGFKLLILDACHAGSERGGKDPTKAPANSEEIGNQFGDLANVVTIASSTANQPSQIWDEKQHSLFTYWLNEGLKGNADTSGDGEVNIDELFDYVHRAVKRTSEGRLGRLQTPVRIVRSAIDGVPTVVRLTPQSLKTVINDVAEQLADKLIENKVAKIGVLEFINDTDGGELLGKEFGLLGNSCAEMLQERLIDLGSGRFSVVDRHRVQTALKQHRFGLADLGSDAALKGLSASTGGMPVVVIGKLKGDQAEGAARNPRVVHVQCKLTQTEGSADLGHSGGTALLNESEWAMIGKSSVIRPEDRQPDRQRPGEDIKPIEDKVVREADERAKGPHPFLDPAFPFRLRIMVGGVERPGKAVGNDWIVELRKGETYTIQVEHSGKQPVAMRLLVDGLNTVSEKESTKGIETWIIGKRVGLDTARSWVLDPTLPDTFKVNNVALWQVQGFLSNDNEKNEMRRFTVVDASQSLAARYKFSDQIGMITAAFYTLTASSERAVGTTAGEKVAETVKHAKGVAPGNLIGVVHVKYVEAN